MKKTISFTKAPENMKYLGTKLTREVKDSHNENDKTLHGLEDLIL
jgi:hypothetical protein